MKQLTFITKTGSATEDLFDDLARLRIEVFRDFPYLYEGSVSYERDYLKTYARSQESLVFAVYDGPRMIGATTCIPLKDETGDVQEPFLKNGIPLDEVFYFGESILLKPYRGRGLGHRFFDVREAHAAGSGSYRTTCFCAVERPADHPLKPADYRPNDVFWRKRGYTPLPGLTSFFEWTDLGEHNSTQKPMTYWMRSLE